MAAREKAINSNITWHRDHSSMAPGPSRLSIYRCCELNTNVSTAASINQNRQASTQPITGSDSGFGVFNLYIYNFPAKMFGLNIENTTTVIFIAVAKSQG